MSDNKHRSAVHETVHALGDDLLGTGINARSCLVKYHYRRIGYRGTRYGYKLALTLRELRTILGEHRIVALRKSADKVIGIRKLCCRNDFFIGSVKLAVADILLDSAGKQIGSL